ncbi:MAG: hypothetical protein P8O86_01770 [Actinomycetota bacterium]|nr:hypothetical protein [Actinomycetota bacterium]
MRTKSKFLKSTITVVFFLMFATSTNAAAQSSDQMSIVTQSFSAELGESIDLQIQLPNLLPRDNQLIITLHEPVLNEQAFLFSTTGEKLGGVLSSATSNISELEISEDGLTNITLQITEDKEPFDQYLIQAVRPGVYPISLELRTNSQELVDGIISHLIRVPSNADETELLEVILIDSLDIKAIKSFDKSEASWLTTLHKHQQVPMSLVAPPKLLEDFQDTPTFKLWEQNNQSHELIRSSFVPIDEALLTNAGLGTEASLLIEKGLETLISIGSVAPSTLWIETNATDVSQFDARWARGIRHAVLSSKSLVATDNLNPRQPVEIRSQSSLMTVLIFDDLAPRQLKDSPHSAAHRTLSHLATIAFTQESPKFITLDISPDEADSTFTDYLLEGIASLFFIEPLLASEAIGKPLAITAAGVPLQYQIKDKASAIRPDFSVYRKAKTHLSAYRSMIRDEDATDHDNFSQELLYSLSDDLKELEQQTIWRRIIDYVRQRSSLLDAPPEETVQMTSRSAAVPFSFQNRSKTALRVELRIISEKITVEDFDDGETTTLVLEPGITTHRFNLRSLSSGSFPIKIELLSPNGLLVLSETQSVIRATAPTGVGLALTLGAALFLAIWWIADSRRRRSL